MAKFYLGLGWDVNEECWSIVKAADTKESVEYSLNNPMFCDLKEGTTRVIELDLPDVKQAAPVHPVVEVKVTI